MLDVNPMKHCFLPSLFLSFLLAALALPVCAQPALFYENNGVVQTPPGLPPTIDAINFVNYNFFSVTVTNIDEDPATESFNTLLFETLDTLNFTNFAYMAGNPGFDFHTIPSTVGPERMAANFFNSGNIYVGSETNVVVVSVSGLTYAGAPQMRVEATNIFNPGAIVLGYDGLCSFNGQTVDLSRGSLQMTNSATTVFRSVSSASLVTSVSSFNGGIFDGFWGLGTNGFDLNAQFGFSPQATPPFPVTTRDYKLMFEELVLAANGLSYWDVTPDWVGNTNTFLESAVFVNNTNSAFAPKVFFLGGEILIQWSPTTPIANPLYVNVLDDFPLINTNGFVTNGYAGVGITRPTIIPLNFFVFESAGALLGLGLSATPSAIPFGFFPSGTLTNLWSAYEAIVSPISVILSDTVGADVTNMPGRIELSSSQSLDLNMARISSLNYLSFQATNHFLGSSHAQISAPYADFNLRSTNGLLDITNLVNPFIPYPEGYIDLWSTCLTNSQNPYLTTNVFHILFADAHLSPTFPARSETLFLTSTNAAGGDDNLIIHDVFHVFRNLRLDASRITIATNAPGAATSTGALYVDDASIIWPDATPRLQYLTNFGGIATFNAVFFGGSQSSPFYNTNFSVPYVAFVNRGFITNYGSLIWSQDFENSGLMTAATGDIRVQQAQNAILTNGFLFAVNGNIALNSGYLFASNTLFQAGAGLSLAPTNALSDGISNLALIYLANTNYPTNFFNAQLTNANVWSAGDGGLSLLVKPEAGDLLGTTIRDIASANVSVPIVWAAADLGPGSSGFFNNAALGRLILNGAEDSVFAFTGAGGGGNAIYIDDLELTNFTATASDTSGDFIGMSASNITVYFAQARANGVEIAEKLNGRGAGHFVWVSSYNWGYFSSTNLLYPDGLLHRVNAALAASCDLVSNTNGVVNCQSLAPVSIVPLPLPGLSNDVPLLPAINLAPQGQNVSQGASVTFSVLASSASPLTYQWLKNGLPISGAYFPTYTIPSVQATDAGAYSVVVANFAGAVVTPAAPLTLNPPPAITAQPQNLTLAPGAAAVFSVTASGLPPLSYQWYFNGAAIAGATDAVYAKGNVQLTDAGSYSVVVSDPFGSVSSLAATLDVVAPDPPPKPAARPAILPPQATLSAQNASASAFAAALGSYYGLFSDTNGASAASSGGFTAKVTSHGKFTAKLTLAGHSYSVSGAFSTNSTASVPVPRGSGLAPLNLTLHLDLDGGGQMLGALAATNWSASLQAYRAAPAAQKTRYTLVIQPPDAPLTASPAGYGYGTITVDSLGNLLFAGALPDGTKVSQSAMRSQDGYWPLYGSLYGGGGCLLSWLQFANTASNGCSGQLIWLNPAGATPKTYVAGFTNLITAAGSLYSPAGALAGFTGGTLRFSNAVSTVANGSFSLDARQRVDHLSSKLSLTVATSSGLFNGAVWSADLGQTLSFQGVLCGQAANGFGFFLLNPQPSGKVLLELAQ
jgi:hypothetical protein